MQMSLTLNAEIEGNQMYFYLNKILEIRDREEVYVKGQKTIVIVLPGVVISQLNDSGVTEERWRKGEEREGKGTGE